MFSYQHHSNTRNITKETISIGFLTYSLLSSVVTFIFDFTSSIEREMCGNVLYMTTRTTCFEICQRPLFLCIRDSQDNDWIMFLKLPKEDWSSFLLKKSYTFECKVLNPLSLFVHRFFFIRIT